jgi:hypothetical protein
VGFDGLQAFHSGMLLKLGPETQCQVRHAIKIRLPPLVYPSEELLGAKALLAQAFAKQLQTMKIKFKEIGLHG